MTDDERALRADLAAGPFRLGQARGKWHLLEVEWPYAYIAVAADRRENAPGEFAFRFLCSGYRRQAPTAAPVDPTSRQPLAPARWPGGTDRVALAFNPNWRADAIYVGLDGTALIGHEPWRTQFPGQCWTENHTIVAYLELLYGLLHSPSYAGLRAS